MLGNVIGVLALSLALQLNRHDLEGRKAGVLLLRGVEKIRLLLLLLRGVGSSWVQTGLCLNRLLLRGLLLLLLHGRVNLCLRWLLLLVCLLGRGHGGDRRRDRRRSCCCCHQRRVRSN